jgi:hypothetical protein
MSDEDQPKPQTGFGRRREATRSKGQMQGTYRKYKYSNKYNLISFRIHMPTAVSLLLCSHHSAPSLI